MTPERDARRPSSVAENAWSLLGKFFQELSLARQTRL
jgi:hypothetical protein